MELHKISALTSVVFVYACCKSWAALSGTAGNAHGALFISLSDSMIFRAPQAWLNQCSDFITLHGDGAYFTALLIYSNKSAAAATLKYYLLPLQPTSTPPWVDSKKKKKKRQKRGEDKSEFLELEGTDNAPRVQV